MMGVFLRLALCAALLAHPLGDAFAQEPDLHQRVYIDDGNNNIVGRDTPLKTNDSGTAGTGISQPTGGTGLTGWLSGIYKAVTGTLTVAQPDARATAQTLSAGTLNAAVSVTLNNGEGVVGWTVVGLTASGATLTAEGSNDGGATWSAINTTAPGTGLLSTTVTADGQFRVNAAGHTNVRLRVSTAATGTITASFSASSVGSLMALSAPLPPGTNPLGGISVSPTATNPPSTLALTNVTTAYGVGQLIANSSSGTALTVPSFNIATAGGAAAIARLRVSINDPTSPGWSNVSIAIDLWSAAPTFASANGDRSTFFPATGAGVHLGTYSCLLSPAYGDGVFGECQPNVPPYALPKLTSGTLIYWTARTLGASGTVAGGTGKVLSMTAELQN